MLLRCAFLLFPALVSAQPVDITTRDDPHSYAEPLRVKTQHIALDLNVDFAARLLAGSVVLTIKTLDPDVRELKLDTRDLAIKSVEVAKSKRGFEETSFTLGEVDPVLGQALIIQLPKRATQVRIHYATTQKASGLQWLTAAQTKGKKHPFLFTQSQAIHARSWIPLQDTPAVRATYSARIRTPKSLLAVMSANNDPLTARDGDYSFDMPQAIPSYLIALGVGNLQFKAVSERSGVYAEPELLEAAWQEFGATEDMIATAEKLYGPYRWGRYDLLILPPSFPFGGMENPRLSFITPTVIAGDRSLVSLIAHELAHSWSGNLVTNATWRDFWLNEGFTVFFEGRIMEAMYGEARAKMETVLGVDGLKRELKELPLPDQRLVPDLRGRDPDEGFSAVPYVKGQWFLLFLERRFGREVFDIFLRGYFDHFAFKSVTTADFLEYLDTHLLKTNPGRVTRAEIDEWLFQPGVPKNAPEQVSDRFAKVGAARDAFLQGAAPKSLKTADWSAHEWLHFLNTQPTKLKKSQLKALDQAFGFTRSSNAEIAHAWLMIAVRNGYRDADAALDQYLLTIGRRKLVVPLYEALLKMPERRAHTLEIFAQAKLSYHPLTVSTVEALIVPSAAPKP